ncbi:hypothetical protein C8J57DRAFT_1643753 [Mycena rebaudengoi]|nr:hypothetical protein C8J57DRAFT_1643753 [Mycena rebaudengoi]
MDLPLVRLSGEWTQVKDSSEVLRIAVGRFADNRPAYASLLATLRMVCRRWDGVLVGDAILWSNIHVDSWTPLKRVALWIDRSKGCGLRIHLVIGRGWPRAVMFPKSFHSPTAFVDAVFDLVGPSFSRCCHFYADSKDADATTRLVHHLCSSNASTLVDLHLRLFPDYFPSLNLLGGGMSVKSANPRYIFDGYAPRLACLTLHRCLFSSAAGYEFCKDITDLRLEDLWTPLDIGLSELLDVFRSTPRLTRLRLRFVDCTGTKATSGTAPVLAHLVHLDFAPMSIGSCQLLSRLVMPALDTLDLLIEQSQLMSPLLSLCGPAFEKITVASLALHYVCGADFGALLCGMRRLRSLDCRETEWGVDGMLGDIGSDLAAARFEVIA